MAFLYSEISPAFILQVVTLFAILYCFIAFATLIINLKTRSRTLSKLAPQPPGHWLTGHIKQFLGDEESINWQRTAYKYGRFVKVNILMPFLMINHPDDARAILSKPDTKDTITWTKFFKPWLGNSIVTSKGARWHRNRRLLTPAFHFSILHGYLKVFNDGARQLAERWRKACGHPVDVFPDMEMMTMQALVICAFGKNKLSDRDMRAYIVNTRDLLSLLMQRVQVLPYYIDWFYYYISSPGRKFGRCLHTVHHICRKVLDMKKTPNAHETTTEQKQTSFLDLLVLAKDEDGNGLSESDILDEIQTFMFAGHDTTSSAIPYVLYHLALHKEYQDKCRDEVNGILIDRTEIFWDDLGHMAYLTMCVKESLRLTSPVSGTNRRLAQDSTLTDGTVIPAGTDIIVNLLGIHHNTDIWKDPEVFNPERFNPDNSAHRHSHAYMPFSAGPRNCIGMNFALSEIKLVVATIVKNFKITHDPTRPLKPKIVGVLKSEDGMWLKFDPIYNRKC